MAFAFSVLLYPHHQQFPLRGPCPDGRRYGLTMFRYEEHDGLGSASPPVALLSVYPQCKKEYPATLPFGYSLSVPLAA
jgi:hypothetical protein